MKNLDENKDVIINQDEEDVIEGSDNAEDVTLKSGQQ